MEIGIGIKSFVGINVKIGIENKNGIIPSLLNIFLHISIANCLIIQQYQLLSYIKLNCCQFCNTLFWLLLQYKKLLNFKTSSDNNVVIVLKCKTQKFSYI